MNARQHPCQLLLPALLALSGLGIGPAAGQGSGSFDDEVLARVNQFRQANGRAPVARNSALDVSAQLHSEDMAHRNVMSHYGANGSNPAQRIHAAGYVWQTWGENVAYGYTTPAAVMNGWINSPGHRANLLNGSFHEIGIGVAQSPTTGRLYWTQDFGTRAGGVRSPASVGPFAPNAADTPAAPGSTDGTLTPRIDTLSPNAGPAGTQVVITGRGLGNGDGACLVLFGVTGSSLVETWTDTQIVVRLYGAVFGQGTLRVCNRDGQTSNAAIFRTTP
jgi:Cysteine-rich secretory protein family/IPT/TIG domain